MNNYTEYESSDIKINFETITESSLKGFNSTRFRQYLKKESVVRFAIPLDTAAENVDFKKFYETEYKKLNKKKLYF